MTPLDSQPDVKPPYASAPKASDTQAGAGELQTLKADKLIRDYALMAAAAGFIPSPLIDVVAVMALEVRMIGDMAKVYAFPMPRKLVSYKILISLVGSVGPVYFAGHVPGLAFAGVMSISNGIAVYAVGKVFQKHFESGGIFLSQDSSVVRKYFKQSYREGKQIVPALAGRA